MTRATSALSLPPPRPVSVHKKRGPKGICARGVSTNKGVLPLELFPAAATATATAAGQRALPVLPARMESTLLPAPIGGPRDSAYKPADLQGPCDMCGAVAADPKADSKPYHVLRATGRGCMPVGHGVFCGAECARTALFRHPAYRHWDDMDRYVAYQTMLHDPHQPVAYACALFHDSVYCSGKRTTDEVAQSRFRVQRASEQPAVARKDDVRQELFADFFKMAVPAVATTATVKEHQKG